MKKFLFVTALFFCTGLALEAQKQAYVRLVRGSNECGRTALVYTDNTEVEIDVTSCPNGECVFDTGNNETAYIIINDVPCYPSTTTQVNLGSIIVNVREEDTVNGPLYIVE